MNLKKTDFSESKNDNEIIAHSITLGMVLRIIREMSGLTIKQLSAALNMHPSAINRIENDLCKPSSETLEKYSTFFDIDADNILFWSKRSKIASITKVKDILFSMLIKAAKKRNSKDQLL